MRTECCVCKGFVPRAPSNPRANEFGDREIRDRPILDPKMPERRHWETVLSYSERPANTIRENFWNWHRFLDAHEPRWVPLRDLIAQEWLLQSSDGLFRRAQRFCRDHRDRHETRRVIQDTPPTQMTGENSRASCEWKD